MSGTCVQAGAGAGPGTCVQAGAGAWYLCSGWCRCPVPVFRLVPVPGTCVQAGAGVRYLCSGWCRCLVPVFRLVPVSGTCVQAGAGAWYLCSGWCRCPVPVFRLVLVPGPVPVFRLVPVPVFRLVLVPGPVPMFRLVPVSGTCVQAGAGAGPGTCVHASAGVRYMCSGWCRARYMCSDLKSEPVQSPMTRSTTNHLRCIQTRKVCLFSPPPPPPPRPPGTGGGRAGPGRERDGRLLCRERAAWHATLSCPATHHRRRAHITTVAIVCCCCCCLGPPLRLVAPRDTCRQRRGRAGPPRAGVGLYTGTD